MIRWERKKIGQSVRFILIRLTAAVHVFSVYRAGFLRLPAGFLQLGDDDFLHAHHGLDGLGGGKQAAHVLGDYLPGQAKLVFAPAALLMLGRGGQLFTVVINLAWLPQGTTREMVSLKR